MKDWEIKIKKVDNGYVLTGEFHDGSENTTQIVIEIDDSNPLEAMKKVLYEIMEYFAIYNSKHDEKILMVEIIDNREQE